MDLLWLMLASMASSVLTSAIGLGGGLLIMVVMPMFLPLSAVIAIQSIFNLFSNGSRALLSAKKIKPGTLWSYAVGGLLGTCLGYPFIGVLSEEVLAWVIAIFILLTTWTNILKRAGAVFDNAYITACIQAFLAIFVGSVGAISIALLVKQKLSRDVVIATNAAQMSVLNVFRVAAFVLAGFSFAHYAPQIVAMLLGAILGSVLGRSAKNIIPEKLGVLVLKWVTTVLAIKLLF